MKIAMVSEHASPLAVLGGDDAGGQNVHVAALAPALADRGHTVEVLHPSRRPGAAGGRAAAPRCERRPRAGRSGPAPSARTPCPPTCRPSAVARRALAPHRPARRRARALLDVRRRRAAGRGAARAPRWSRRSTRSASSSAGTRASADTSPPDRLAREEHLARAADAVIATCSDEVRELLALGARPDRLHVAPCGVDLDAFRPGPVRRACCARCAGSCRSAASCERKGVRTLIEALPLGARPRTPSSSSPAARRARARRRPARPPAAGARRASSAWPTGCASSAGSAAPTCRR